MAGPYINHTLPGALKLLNLDYKTILKGSSGICNSEYALILL